MSWDLDGDGEHDDGVGLSVALSPAGEGTETVSARAGDPGATTTAVLTLVVTDVETEPERLSGQTRVETAIATSRANFGPDSTDAVVLARSDVFADALAGTALAVRVDAPLLLTPRSGVPATVRSELERVLRADGTVYVLGGTSAMPEWIVTALIGHDVVRLAGATRHDTAARIADEIVRLTGEPRVVLIARGDDFPDGLAAGAVAGIAEGVVVLSDGDRPVPATTALLTAHPGADRIAVGGHAARAYPQAYPVVGSDRFETATMLADVFLDDPVAVGVARGDDFPDAMTGGAHIGLQGGALVLTLPDLLPEPTVTYLRANAPSIDTAYTYGGEAAIGAEVRDRVAALVSGHG